MVRARKRGKVGNKGEVDHGRLGTAPKPGRKASLASHGNSGYSGFRAERLVPMRAHRRDELGGGGGAGRDGGGEELWPGEVTAKTRSFWVYQ